METRWTAGLHLTQIIAILDTFSCEMRMSEQGTELQLKNFCASFLILPDEIVPLAVSTHPQVIFLWHALKWIEP